MATFENRIKLHDESSKVLQNIAREANSLMSSVKNVVAAYVSLKSAQAALSMSDNFVNTTSRLNMMNDGLQTTAELNQKIYESAQRSRASFNTTADAVAKLGMQAGNAFKSNDELIAFSELLNKSFVIAGTKGQAAESVMYNLTQAMSSGVIKGQDFNSIMQNTPQILQQVAKFMGKDVSELKEMAHEGLITAKTFKDAMLANAVEISAKFEEMPDTFEDVWTKIKNTAQMSFSGVFQKMNDILNSPIVKQGINNVVNGITWLSGIAENVIDNIGAGINWVSEHMYMFTPIIETAKMAFSTLGEIGSHAWGMIMQAVDWVTERWRYILPVIDNVQNAISSFGDVAHGVLDAMGTAIEWVIDNWKSVRIVLIAVAAAVGTYLVLTNIVKVATMAWTGVQWLLNAALNANPIGLIIIAIAALVAAIAVIADKVGGFNILWKIVWAAVVFAIRMAGYGIMFAFNWLLNGLDNFTIGWLKMKNGVQDLVGQLKVNVLTILQNMANGAIDIINGLINAVRWLPGISIEPIKQVTFGAAAAVEEEAKKQQRAAELESQIADIEAIKAARGAAVEAIKTEAQNDFNAAWDEIHQLQEAKKAQKAQDEAELTERAQKLENEAKDKKDENPDAPEINPFLDGSGKYEYIEDGSGKYEYIEDGSVKVKNKDKIKISEESLRALEDIGVRAFQFNYQQLTPQLTVEKFNVYENAEVDGVVGAVFDKLAEVSSSRLTK